MQISADMNDEKQEQLRDRLMTILSALPKTFRGDAALTSQWITARLSDEEMSVFNALHAQNPLAHFLWLMTLFIQTGAWQPDQSLEDYSKYL